jgi:hypothetical protein
MLNGQGLRAFPVSGSLLQYGWLRGPGFGAR